MDLSIIIVSWNVKEKLRDNLTAIFASQIDFSLEVFVVDNASVDETSEMVKQDFNQVKLIANQENVGFARANNQALKLATGRYVLLLNPDNKVFDNTLAQMIKWMDENSQASVAGCLLVDEQGQTIRQVRKFPNVWDQLAIILKIPHLFPSILNNYLVSNFDYTQPAVVDSIRGSFFFLRRDAIEKIGPLDERFFVWFEEVDYCRRVKMVGGEVWYTPVAKCQDLVGASFSQLPRGKTQIYFRDSMLTYFKKWHQGWQFWLLKIFWPIGITLARLGEKMKIKFK